MPDPIQNLLGLLSVASLAIKLLYVINGVCCIATMSQLESPDMRIQITVSGSRAIRVRQMMAINGFRSENEAIQYLVNRGLEHCSGAIRQWEMLKEVQERTLASQADMFASMETILKDSD